MKIEIPYGVGDTVQLSNGVTRQIQKISIDVGEKIYCRYFVDEDSVVTDSEIVCKLVPQKKKSKGVDNGKETIKKENQSKKS